MLAGSHVLCELRDPWLQNFIEAKNTALSDHCIDGLIGSINSDTKKQSKKQYYQELRWCLTCLSGGFLRIKFRFFSEFVNESSFSENENLGISFERFLPIFWNPMHALGGKANKRSLRSAFRIIPAPAIPPPKKLKVYSRKTERKSNFLSTSKAQNWLQELQQ